MESHPGDTIGKRFATFWGAIFAFFAFALLAMLLHRCSSIQGDPRNVIRSSNLEEIEGQGQEELKKLGWHAKRKEALKTAVTAIQARKQQKTTFVVPGSETAVRLAAEGVPTPQLVAAGAGTYGTYCSACHQQNATGLVGVAPNIRNADFLAVASDDFLRRSIRMGRPGTAMVPWSQLSKEQVDGVVAFLRSSPEGVPSAKITVDYSKKISGDPEKGNVSFATYCAACHGPKGEGYIAGGSGPGIGLGGFLAVASDDFIYQTLKHGRAGTPMRPFMGPTGLANLEEEEVGDIIAYLRTLGEHVPSEVEVAGAPDPHAGKKQFGIHCATCHQSGGTGLIGFAPSIRNRDFLAISSDDFIRKTVKEGRPGTTMAPRPDLSDRIVGDIIAYLRALPIANAVEVTVDPDKKHHGDAAVGGAKYATFCASCHGPKGEGYVAGGSGPAIGLPGFLSAASDDYIYQTLVRGRIGTAMRPFIGPAGIANLSDSDAADIITYLRGLQ